MLDMSKHLSCILLRLCLVELWLLEKIAVSCGLWKSCCEKEAMVRVEVRLVKQSWLLENTYEGTPHVMHVHHTQLSPTLTDEWTRSSSSSLFLWCLWSRSAG
jgi:hypothetical protein